MYWMSDFLPNGYVSICWTREGTGNVEITATGRARSPCNGDFLGKITAEQPDKPYSITSVPRRSESHQRGEQG